MKTIEQKSMKLVVGAFLILAAFNGTFSDERGAVGPHGGQVISGNLHTVEVSVDRKKGKMDVYLRNHSTQKAKDIGVTLFDANEGVIQEVSLQAMGADRLESHYISYFNPLGESQIGIEFKIRFGNEHTEVLRAKLLEWQKRK